MRINGYHVVNCGGFVAFFASRSEADECARQSPERMVIAGTAEVPNPPPGNAEIGAAFYRLFCAVNPHEFDNITARRTLMSHAEGLYNATPQNKGTIAAIVMQCAITYARANGMGIMELIAAATPFQKSVQTNVVA